MGAAMPHTQPNPADSPPAGRADQEVVRDELLARVKEVARQIAERCRRALGDTATDTPALPGNPTDEVPPVA